jgi:hypothetical protein
VKQQAKRNIERLGPIVADVADLVEGLAGAKPIRRLELVIVSPKHGDLA